MTIHMDTETFERHEVFGPATIAVGKTYILIERRNLNSGAVWHDLIEDNGTGIPGNMDGQIHRYHGWRGTTNNISTDALGCRRVEVIHQYKNGNYRITLSDDLKPDTP